MKKETIKNIVIVILVLALMFMIVMQVLRNNSHLKTSKFLEEIVVLQGATSGYIGKLKSDTFGVYKIEELLLGATDINDIENTKIKDNKDEDLKPLAIKDEAKTQGEVTYYKLDLGKIEQVLNIGVTTNDVTWYISNTGSIKVSFTLAPSWWAEELKVLQIN